MMRTLASRLWVARGPAAARGLASAVPAARSLAAGWQTRVVASSRAMQLPTMAAQQQHLLHTSSAAFEDIVVKMPAPAESISEGELGSIEKRVGEFVAKDEAVVMMETDKANLPVQSPVDGTVAAILFEEGDTVRVGDDLFSVTPGEAPAASPEPAAPVDAGAPPAAAPTPAAPAPAAAAPKPTPAPAPKPAAASAPADGDTAFGGVTRVKMTRPRRRTAERLKESQNVAASLTTFNEIDMSHIMEFRKRFKDKMLKKHDAKLGFMSAFSKACAYAIKEVPAVNAFIDGDEIVYHDYVNISVAVAAPKGLVVPVLRNVEKMSFMDVEKELVNLSTKARDGTLALEDMDGGTFTISNGGVFGSLFGTPILNPPQTGILGMHAINDRPVAINGKVEIRPIMIVALTYDHRLIDGREAVTFLKTVKECIEDPAMMLLD